MSIADEILGQSPLSELLDGHEENHVGYIYWIHFSEALVLTNDAWKEKTAGIPHNNFLIASALNPSKMSGAHELDKEVILLRVLGASPLPQDSELIKTRIEHNQRRTSEEVFGSDIHDGLDPITHAELQYSWLKCRVLGTFYLDENGELRLGSDLENFMSSTKLRVFKPRWKVLRRIVNHINPEVRKKSLEEAKKTGFDALPTPIQIGTVRYTSTARLHRGGNEELVSVEIQPSDFLSRRTAVLWMTRTGKSNTVKTTVASVHMAALKDNVKVGQIIFDVNGEYANANHQDDGSSISEVFGKDCVRYRAIETDGFEDLRTNFYLEAEQGLNLVQSLFRKEKSPFSWQDLDSFMSSSLEEPDKSEMGERIRWEIKRSIFQCILHKAWYPAPHGFQVSIPKSNNIIDQIKGYASRQDPKLEVQIPSSSPVSVEEAAQWFELIRSFNLRIKEEQKAAGKPQLGIESSTKWNSWVNSEMEAFLNMLVRENSRWNPFGGFRAIAKYKSYHSSRRNAEVTQEILQHLKNGKIVILDLSAWPYEVREVLSKRIAQQIFDNSFADMHAGKIPANMVIYVEEAHNLIGRQDNLSDTWPRIAKEGAKAKIALVYATQEPSSIHPNILANTENWFVTHLNNEDELKALGKFYDFADFHDSLKTAQDVGFARIKTLSSPFVIPTQINRFTPEEIKKEVSRFAKY